MNALVVIAGLVAFSFFACNVGTGKWKEPVNTKVVVYVLIACLLGWLLWPVIGPVVMLIFHSLNTFNTIQ